MACFRQGTHIATSRGDIAVEDLRIGDRATLARGPGSHAGVRWIGRRSIDCAGHPRPHDVWPVRVAAHGFGAGLPARDLWLSPDHAVFIDGVLIPVRCLLNDATVVQKHTSCITYFHVELPCHDMLLAEGLPCESYLDVGNRAAFENGGVVMQAHPDFASATWEACGCAPLVVSGPKLEAARLLVNKYAVDVMARRRAAGGRAA